MFYLVKFCGRNFTYGALWLVNRPVFTNIKWTVDDVAYIWVLKIYFQCENAYFQKKNFEINFQCERGLEKNKNNAWMLKDICRQLISFLSKIFTIRSINQHSTSGTPGHKKLADRNITLSSSTFLIIDVSQAVTSNVKLLITKPKWTEPNRIELYSTGWVRRRYLRRVGSEGVTYV